MFTVIGMQLSSERLPHVWGGARRMGTNENRSAFPSGFRGCICESKGVARHTTAGSPPMNRYQAIVEIVRAVPPHRRFASAILALLILAIPVVAIGIIIWRRF